MIRASLYFVIPFDFSFWPLTSVFEIPSVFSPFPDHVFDGLSLSLSLSS